MIRGGRRLGSFFPRGRGGGRGEAEVGGAFPTAATFIFQLSKLSNVRLSLQRPSSRFLTGVIEKESSEVLIIHTVPPVAISINAHNVFIDDDNLWHLTGICLFSCPFQ